MFLLVLTLACLNSLSTQEEASKCIENTVCIPYSECPEVEKLLQNDELLADTRNLLCGYAHEPFVCCKRDCKTPNGNYGNVVHIDKCPHLKYSKYSSDRQRWNFLRESEVNRTHVCCKKGEEKYVVVPPAPVAQVSEPICTTPNGEIGKCLEVEKCDFYHEVANEVDEKYRFINDSYCGWWNGPMVCCGNVNFYRENHASNLPDLGDCGKWESQQKVPQWLALIRQKGSTGGCAGALINENYVLSTTGCYANLTNPEILIGECVSNTTLPSCTFQPLKSLAFPLHKYHKSEDTGMVLIKLNREAQSTPICLPTSVLPLWIDIDIVGVTQKGSTWKPFQITTTSIENQICESEYKDAYINGIVCIENAICEETVRQNLLQYLVVQYENDRWILQGLINREICYGRGNNLFHAISAHKFVPWIKSNVP